MIAALTKQELNQKTKRELLLFAKQLNIKGRSLMKKDQLIQKMLLASEKKIFTANPVQ